MSAPNRPAALIDRGRNGVACTVAATGRVGPGPDPGTSGALNGLDTIGTAGSTGLSAGFKVLLPFLVLTGITFLSVFSVLTEDMVFWRLVFGG